MTTAYLDTSALVKLVRSEPESDALRASLETVEHRLTSMVGRIELERAARRLPAEGVEERLATTLEPLEILPLHVANAAIAGAVTPRSLRSLDAIHLATLLEVAAGIDAFYCYDLQLADAARAHGINVVAPE